MKKLLLLTFLFAPLASHAGDYQRLADPEQVYASLDVAEQIDSQELGKTIYFKKTRNVFCSRIATLDAGGTNDIECFYFTEADLGR